PCGPSGWLRSRPRCARTESRRAWRWPAFVLLLCGSSLLSSTRHFPWLNARQRQSSQLRRAHDVLADDIAFEVDAVTGLNATQIRMRHRVRHDLHVETVGTESGNSEADAIHGDRSAVHDVRREARRKTHFEPVKIGLRGDRFDLTDRVHVPLNEMAAKAAVHAQRALQVHSAAARQPTEGRHAGGLGTHIRMDLEML